MMITLPNYRSHTVSNIKRIGEQPQDSEWFTGGHNGPERGVEDIWDVLLETGKHKGNLVLVFGVLKDCIGNYTVGLTVLYVVQEGKRPMAIHATPYIYCVCVCVHMHMYACVHKGSLQRCISFRKKGCIASFIGFS
jgi:hypothetical protein